MSRLVSSVKYGITLCLVVLGKLRQEMGVWIVEFSNWFGRKSLAEMTFQNVKEESRNLILNKGCASTRKAWGLAP